MIMVVDDERVSGGRDGSDRGDRCVNDRVGW